jgi:hypothetical protein
MQFTLLGINCGTPNAKAVPSPAPIRTPGCLAPHATSIELMAAITSCGMYVETEAFSVSTEKPLELPAVTAPGEVMFDAQPYLVISHTDAIIQ